MKAKKLKGDLPGGEEAKGRAERISQIREIRQDIANLNAKKLGITPDALKTTKANLYAELNRSTPFYMQTNNVDILYKLDGVGRVVAGQRTCNVTSLSIALEGLGINSSDFTGDRQLLGLILNEQQTLMTNWSEKEEERSVESAMASMAKEKDEKKKEKKKDKIRNHHTKKREAIANWDLSGFRLPDFMQVVVIYVMLTQEIFLSDNKKVKALNLPIDDLKKMAVDNPTQFTETVTAAHRLARNAILQPFTFSRYANLFGVKSEMKSLPNWKQIYKVGEWGRMRWDIQELEEEIEKQQAKLDGLNKEDNKKDKKANKARQTIQNIIDNLKWRKNRKEKWIDKKNTSFTSLDEFEDTLPLQDYKDLVNKTYRPLLDSGKQVEISLYNHFVYLVAIEDDGVTVHEVGEGDGIGGISGGKQKKISWEKARAAGYFYNYNVFYK